MVFLGIDNSDKQKLEAEVVPDFARLQLTRLARAKCICDDRDVELVRINRFVNLSRTVLGKPVYVLHPDDMGMYEVSEYAWHFAELELVFRRPTSAELSELLADMVQSELLSISEVNSILENNNVSFKVTESPDSEIGIELLSVDEIEDKTSEPDHPNIRALIGRMDQAFESEDYSGVLHASASIFETLAKIVFNSASVESSTLGSIFEGYKNRSKLPGFLLDHIKNTYDRRNSEPLAGHGSTLPSTVSKDDAIVLVELTKPCVRLERKLADQSAQP